MKKKSNHKYNDFTNLVLFPAEDTLKAEQGNLWSGAAKEDKINTRKGKFAKVDEYQKKDDNDANATFGTATTPTSATLNPANT